MLCIQKPPTKIIYSLGEKITLDGLILTLNKNPISIEDVKTETIGLLTDIGKKVILFSKVINGTKYKTFINIFITGRINKVVSIGGLV